MRFNAVLSHSSRMKPLTISHSQLSNFHNITDLTPPSFLNTTLTRGLKFIPPCKPPNHDTLITSLQTFFRRLLLKQHFREHPERENRYAYYPKLYRADGNWTPNTTIQWEQWTARVQSEFETTFETSKLLRSLTDKTDTIDTDLILTRHYLKLHPELMIVATDKNLGPALITRQDYIDMCLKHLCDTNTYTQMFDRNEILNNPKTHERIQKLNKTALEIYPWIKNLRQFLESYNDDPKIPLFHCLPKVHKSTITGRPIAGAHSWLTTPISTLLSHILRTSILSSGRYDFLLRDSKQLVAETENLEIADTDLFVSFDVETLYPRMVHEGTVKAVKYANWHIHGDKLKKWACDATELILEQSFVEFGETLFKQCKGMAMGTNAAVELANIYVAHYIECKESFKERKTRFMRLWKRFIDDVFMIWKGTRAELDQFIVWLNSQNPSLRFTAHIHESETDFLDLTAFRHNHRLKFKIYQKSINRFLYVPFDSNHPRHVFRAFIKGELIRYARNCTRMVDFWRQRGLFGIRLENRGYPQSFIQRVFREVNHSDRNRLLDEKRQVETEDADDNKVFITVPFHPVVVDMQPKEIISRNLREEDNIEVVVGYRNPPNLGSILTTSRLNRRLTQMEIDTRLPRWYIDRREAKRYAKEILQEQKRKRELRENPPHGVLVLHSPARKRRRRK